MADRELYKDQLLQHYKHPHNKSDDGLAGATVTARGRNPRCGDDIEIGLYLNEDHIDQVKFRGRGCSICLASTSMMTEAVSGTSISDAIRLTEQMNHWFGNNGDESSTAPHVELEPLAAVKSYRARRKCVLLSWDAQCKLVSPVLNIL